MTGITLIAVAAGGACGALLRYGAVLVTGAGIFGFAGPMATLTVNICGSAMMGLVAGGLAAGVVMPCLLYTSPSPRDRQKWRMPSWA